MNPKYQRICIYLLVITVIPTVMNYYYQENKKKEHSLGSMLSAYFYNMNANAKPNLAAEYSHYIQATYDPELVQFYKNFDWGVKKSNVEYDSVEDVTWQFYQMDGVKKTNYINYWQTARPAMRNFYTSVIAPEEIKVPVVHFRCSDVPFIRHPIYHLTKVRTVNWMAEEIKRRGYNEVVMITCNKHRRKAMNVCTKFANFYAQVFADAGITVTKQCNSIYKDFAIMVHAPVLIALNQSSYSFMAGIAKEPNDFISCNIGREFMGRYLLNDEADWLQDTHEPLLHKDVKDYHDVHEILTKLVE